MFLPGGEQHFEFSGLPSIHYSCDLSVAWVTLLVHISLSITHCFSPLHGWCFAPNPNPDACMTIINNEGILQREEWYVIACASNLFMNLELFVFVFIFLEFSKIILSQNYLKVHRFIMTWFRYHACNFFCARTRPNIIHKRESIYWYLSEVRTDTYDLSPSCLLIKTYCYIVAHY